MSDIYEEIQAFCDGSWFASGRLTNILYWQRALESIEKYRETHPSDPLFEETFEVQIKQYADDLEQVFGEDEVKGILARVKAEAKRNVYDEGYNWFDTWEDE